MTPVGRTLRPIELFTLAFGTIAGIAWLFLTGPWLRAAGPLGARSEEHTSELQSPA